jgi:hypothetical protein
MMKPTNALIMSAVFLACWWDAPISAAQEDPLYLHWFTFDEEQDFVPLQSIKIRLGERVDSAGLKGLVLKDAKGLHATLEGSYGLSVGDYGNYIQLDTIFSPVRYNYSGAIFVTFFAVSTTADADQFHSEFLEKQKNKPREDDYSIDLTIPLFVDSEPIAESEK